MADNSAKASFRIKPSGELIVEGMETGGQDCRGFVKMSARMGTVVEDEQTGPDCDTVHEGVGGGDSVV